MKPETKKRIMDRLMLYGYSFGTAGLIVVYYMFLKAYYSGKMRTTVLINRFGEANLEFALLPIILGVNLIGFGYLLSKYDD